MLAFEFRNVIGNPYVHIFGVGMPILMAIIITRAVAGEMGEGEMLTSIVTSVFLGVGALIPMATIFMGYGIAHAQELEKGIPQRMELFGIRTEVSLANRILSELLFMLAAFGIYFVVGYGVVKVKAPTAGGAAAYAICMLVFSGILFCLAHGIAVLLRKFSRTYCVTMLLYFAMMILGGMMGITYDNMPAVMRAAARLLPVTYINRDFAAVWSGESYNFMPMVQSYLLLGAVAGILLFVTVRRETRRLH
ncbi:MAG: ABC transporter permease [Acetatifactor muris]|nr:ABC transporter permease [Acetatifactor muris]